MTPGKILDSLARQRRLRVAGLMSGTSADGVNVAVVDIITRRAGLGKTPVKVELVAWDSYPFPKKLREAIFRLFDPQASTAAAICHYNFVLGELFADAVLRISSEKHIPLSSVELIGSHGQTIWHQPQGKRFSGRAVASTLQIGEPCLIAERTGVTTVADFRPRDLAVGGEGAPLVPWTDGLLFAHPRRNRVVQNIGGIANLTWLPAGGKPDAIRAFDTGPGNMMIDRAAQLASRGRLKFDRDGKLAARGRVNLKLLKELLRHEFIRRRPPKSTGRETFGWDYADRIYQRALSHGLSAKDIVATLTAFTATSIAQAYRRFLPRLPDEVILCGGGAQNPILVGMLADELRPENISVRAMDELGIPSEAKEAVSFALLAWAAIKGLPANLPAVTGAQRPVVLGKIIPGNFRISD